MAAAPAPESSSDSEFVDDDFANELEEEFLEEMDDETKEAFRRVTVILQVPKESFNTLIRSCKLLNSSSIDINHLDLSQRQKKYPSATN